MRNKTFLRRLLLAATLFFPVFIASQLYAQPDTWVTSFGTNLQDGPEDILVDDAGNSYIVGYFRDTIHIGSIELASAGKNDIFLAKFDPTGQVTWAKRFGWNADEFGHGLAFDGSGNIIMVGEYSDSTIFVPGDTLYSYDTLWFGAPAPTYDAFWMRIDAGGTVDTIWQGGWYGTEKFFEVEVGGDGRYYIGGLYRTYNGFTFTNPFDIRGWGRGYDDGLWVRSDVHGFMDHKAVVTGRYVDRTSALALIADSLVVMGGSFQDTCYFRDSSLYHVGGFDDDIWIACYSDTGRYKWSVEGVGKGINSLTALVTDASGNIYFGGQFDSTLSMGGQTLAGSRYLDGVLGKLDVNGNVLWLKKLGGNGYDGVQDIRLTASGNLLVTGYFQRDMDLGGSTLSIADSNDQNAYVLLYDPSGNLIWANSLGGNSPDVGMGVDEDAAGYVYAMGTFTGTGRFGQASATSMGAEDIYLVRMNSDGAVFAPEGHLPAIASVNAWPNPTKGELQLAFNLQQAAEVTLQITDLQGRTLMSQPLGKRAVGQVTATCDLQSLPAGMYLYRIQAGASAHAGRVAVVH